MQAYCRAGFICPKASRHRRNRAADLPAHAGAQAEEAKPRSAAGQERRAVIRQPAG